MLRSRPWRSRWLSTASSAGFADSAAKLRRRSPCGGGAQAGARGSFFVPAGRGQLGPGDKKPFPLPRTPARSWFSVETKKLTAPRSCVLCDHASSAPRSCSCCRGSVLPADWSFLRRRLRQKTFSSGEHPGNDRLCNRSQNPTRLSSDRRSYRLARIDNERFPSIYSPATRP